MRFLLGLFFLFAASSGLQAQSSFYQGKSIKLIVGSPAGSNYDQYARLIAPYLTKYIAGNPEVVVQNMGGAGSVIAANHVYRLATPDGLTLLSILPAIYFDQLVGRKEVQFDYAKFAWIGSTDRSNNLLIMRADTPYKTLQDVRGASEPPKCAATGTGSIAYYMPRLLEEVIGTKFNVVVGYPGGPDMDRGGARRSTMSGIYPFGVFERPRSVSDLAQEQFRSCAGADRFQSR